MEVWALLSVAAAFLQNVRNALQKALTGQVSVLGAAYARFVFAAPWAVVLAIALQAGGGTGYPGATWAFAAWTVTGGLCQIAATLMLLHVFTLRNFAVGNTFAKTETVQAALIGLVVLGDRVSGVGLAGILVSLAGVVLMSGDRAKGVGVFNRAAGIGIAAGAAFALSGVAYRAAGLALTGEATFMLRAAFTLAAATLFQTFAMTFWMRAKAPGEIGRIFRAWRVAAPVGIAGMLASFCWFSAFALISAAHVKAVGQIELAFSYLTAIVVFRERPSLRETGAIVLVVAGILLLVLRP